MTTWLPVESAPTDGTPVIGLIGGDEVEVRWAEDRVCVLSSVVSGGGQFGCGWEDTANGLYVDDPEGWRPVAELAREALTHAPCCSTHNAAVDCDTYRRTHVVEPGSDCCPTWTETNPYGGWVPRGCPAGFSSDCGAWTATSPCRCLLMTLPFNEARLVSEAPEGRGS